jgi:hypothetical protein
VAYSTAIDDSTDVTDVDMTPLVLICRVIEDFQLEKF